MPRAPRTVPRCRGVIWKSAPSPSSFLTQKYEFKVQKGKKSLLEALQQVLIKVLVLGLAAAAASNVYVVESANPT